MTILVSTRRALLNANKAWSPLCTLLDLFTDTTGANLSAHIPDKPKTSVWTVGYGTFDINSNQARLTSVDVGKNYGMAFVTGGKADLSAHVIMTKAAAGGTSDGGGIVFRCTDKDNWLLAGALAGGLYCIKIEAGVLSVVAGPTGIQHANLIPYTISVTTSGNNISISFDGGVATLNTASAFNNTATRVGVMAWRLGNEFEILTVE